MIRGVSFNKTEGNAQRAEGMLPVLRAGNIQSELITDTGLIWVPEGKISAQQIIRKEDIIMCTSSGSPSIVGKCAKASHDWQGSFGAFCAGVRTNRDICDPSFLYHFLSSPAFTQWASKSSGANIKNIRKSELEGFQIPLPPLEEQRRIAAILDKSDAIRKKRKQAIELTEQFLHSSFVDMFGDPATNLKGWKTCTLGSVSSQFSDGPFGSNLKSNHYVESGVRVIRLQNIGLGEFIDEDQAFISVEHFQSLIKHQCLPGDILIGTLGDPNLRACILPDDIKVALNKADCVQMRPSLNLVTAEYVTALINQPGTLSLASHLLHGQTRTRISMGTLRSLKIPIPPLVLQKKFSALVQFSRNKIKANQIHAYQSSSDCFHALSKSALQRDLRTARGW